ncbi:MAG: hypothetical protein HKN70_07795 [Gammaproteobacteria bacterium]|nr:hypothetical protein [Gammaproteobacteria bacterium]
MISDDWLGQQLVRVKEWRQQYWASMSFALCTPITVNKLDKALANAQESVKHDRTTTVVKWEFENHHYVLKRYNARTQGHKLKRAFRQTRARRCWLMSYEFQHVGLNVAPPALMYERRFGPIRTTAYYAAEFLPGKELMVALPNMDSEERTRVALAIKRAYAIMRKHRLSHGDMKATNLMWLDNQLYFLDLDAAAIHRSEATWKRAHLRDRKRFLKNWESHPKLLKMFSRI